MRRLTGPDGAGLIHIVADNLDWTDADGTRHCGACHNWTPDVYADGCCCHLTHMGHGGKFLDPVVDRKEKGMNDQEKIEQAAVISRDTWRICPRPQADGGLRIEHDGNAGDYIAMVYQYAGEDDGLARAYANVMVAAPTMLRELIATVEGLFGSILSAAEQRPGGVTLDAATLALLRVYDQRARDAIKLAQGVS